MSKRVKFFIVHITFSALILSSLLCCIFLVWYPSPLSKATGLEHILFLLVLIDVIMGPLLGLLVYKEGKKTLKLDLIIICIFQIIAFLFGSYHIFKGRPVWIVYSVDQFELIRDNEIVSKLHKSPLTGPKFAAIQYSNDLQLKQKEIFKELFEGISLTQDPQNYKNLDQVKLQIQKKSQNLNELEKFNPKQQVENILKKYPEANAWVPLRANAVDMVVLMDKNSAQVVKIVDLRPWK
ncbi:TfpX/TfpZ family type IV pilin accessory protein [Acinetobacter baumannii]|uniref:TfpX/TfpZ family type IV pilin accessory protein n=1 Tax=Acinetobacter baumannii TaxID=470 RepID=UPI0004F514C2|nr:TfpX/TfpZ family type IV pilin accessory protein [Acinetobacter baumannii]MBU3095645.1 type IV pilin accessory protein [Acinetobacter baumannii]MCL6693747.1 type IV pilin accessory protein [Acinetobacter baumannii]MDC4260928.1 type IV pilin accessory protein [Acinetobacter baumannii]MDC4266125.1 type IV pilin accessory protein [Acinetobacter baumannii]MDC5239030.1 type IV pilin accessory protein [Acinetobacter baumannii]